METSQENQATKAQEPTRGTSAPKLRYASKLHIATLNTQGMKQNAKREEIEAWMKGYQIAIMAIQATHIETNTRESRNSYLCGF